MVKKKAKKIMKVRHSGITVLSIFMYIGSALSLLGGLLLIFNAKFLSSLFIGLDWSKYQLPDLTTIATPASFIYLGIFFLVYAVLDFFLARGFWKGQNWARMVFLALVGISTIGDLMQFPNLSLLLDVLLIWYVGFYKPAIDWFN